MYRNGISVFRDKEHVIISTYNREGYVLQQEYTPELAIALADKILQQVAELEREKYTQSGEHARVRKR